MQLAYLYCLLKWFEPVHLHTIHYNICCTIPLCSLCCKIFVLIVSSGTAHVSLSVWCPSDVRPSVCPSVSPILFVRRIVHTWRHSPWAVRDATSVHFRRSITDILLVSCDNSSYLTIALTWFSTSLAISPYSRPVQRHQRLQTFAEHFMQAWNVPQMKFLFQKVSVSQTARRLWWTIKPKKCPKYLARGRIVVWSSGLLTPGNGECIRRSSAACAGQAHSPAAAGGSSTVMCLQLPP